MPDLGALELLGNPSKQPLSYPGPLVEQSGLMVGSWLYSIGAHDGAPLSEWTTTLDGGPLANSSHTSLDEALALTGAARMGDRKPVLAVGSNASPGQLLHKFGDHAIVPLAIATVTGFTIGHSPHVSKPGYIPYIAVTAPQVRQFFTIVWLDSRELEKMDTTEPNYTRVPINGAKVSATLESGETLPTFEVYRGKWGALRMSPDAPPLTASSQNMLLTELGKQPWFQQIVPECSAGPVETVGRLAADPRAREEIKEGFTRRDLVADDRLERVLLR